MYGCSSISNKLPFLYEIWRTLLSCGPYTCPPLRVGLGSGLATGKGWVGTWPVTRLDPIWQRFLTCKMWQISYLFFRHLPYTSPASHFHSRPYPCPVLLRTFIEGFGPTGKAKCTWKMSSCFGGGGSIIWNPGTERKWPYAGWLMKGAVDQLPLRTEVIQRLCIKVFSTKVPNPNRSLEPHY